MDEVLKKFDDWLGPNGPVAVTMSEPLEPVLGKGSLIFPPTFAPPEDKKKDPPYYVIDETSQGKTALIDSLGAQANRLEPLFKRVPYSELVPKASVMVGSREVDLLDAGHRAADALVRVSDKRAELSAAFDSMAKGDAKNLAQLAPTSLVFGVWDSRGIGVKVPRLVGSSIRAYGVEPLTRAAQYFSAFEKAETEALGLDQDFLSGEGLSDAPAGRSHGGVVARGGIRRESVLNLIALRALGGGEEETTLKLRRYILGLALVALTAPLDLFLREGCLLVTSSDERVTRKVVSRDGSRVDLVIDAAAALAYAEVAAKAFVVGPSWRATFQGEAVQAAAKAKKEKKDKEKKPKAAS